MQTETKPKYFRDEDALSIIVLTERVAGYQQQQPFSPSCTLIRWCLPSDSLKLDTIHHLDAWQPIKKTRIVCEDSQSTGFALDY